PGSIGRVFGVCRNSVERRSGYSVKPARLLERIIYLLSVRIGVRLQLSADLVGVGKLERGHAVHKRSILKRVAELPRFRRQLRKRTAFVAYRTHPVSHRDSIAQTIVGQLHILTLSDTGRADSPRYIRDEAPGVVGVVGYHSASISNI